MGTDDRRASIEAAFEQIEKSEVAPIEPAPKPPVEAPALEQKAQQEDAAWKEHKGEQPAEDKSAPAKVYSDDKPPQSWRAPQKAKWAAVDPEVRQEVVRREREHEKLLSETAQARQVAGGFQQVVQPYMARIQALGVHPLTAAQELFKADHMLTTAPPRQRAQFMAKLIADYGVDIGELDAALSGSSSKNPQQDEIDRLLQERLAPFTKFIQDQTSTQQQAQKAQAEKLQSEIEGMVNNEKFPEFDNVREDMADIIEIQSKKGVYLTLEQAYTRAIAMNPEAAARVKTQTEAAQRTAAAREANERARKAKAASSSVGGAPNGTPSGTTVVNDRRATIAAALEQASGR